MLVDDLPGLANRQAEIFSGQHMAHDTLAQVNRDMAVEDRPAGIKGAIENFSEMLMPGRIAQGLFGACIVPLVLRTEAEALTRFEFGIADEQPFDLADGLVFAPCYGEVVMTGDDAGSGIAVWSKDIRQAPTGFVFGQVLRVLRCKKVGGGLRVHYCPVCILKMVVRQPCQLFCAASPEVGVVDGWGISISPLHEDANGYTLLNSEDVLIV